ncbi:MAG TPA: adenylate/guanylate cyclase domain-containing protein [Reyranellaceae bacterium]|nr:adenylate/guanylate cyclase domain-containing protein [Reyranellaceae bacterium]
MTNRDRREWRIILGTGIASALVSGWFGASMADDEHFWRGVAQGVLGSLLIATPIVYVETKSARIALTRRLRRLPLVAYFAIKLLFYLVVIVTGMTLTRVLLALPFDWETFRDAFVFAVIMSVIGNVVFDLGGLLGFDTLRNLLTGRYVHPRKVTRAFLLIDMKDSTGHAERLGAVRFHELLNTFFRDISDAALECDAEIHKYVGDEAILTWSDERAIRDGSCLACPFAVRDAIARNAAHYRKRFNAVPEFRAALHHGEIVAGEIGDVRREIAYVGDTLNVAARLLEAAKELKRDVLASAELLERSTLPPGVRSEGLPTLSVRGRAAPLGVSALVAS